MISSLNIVSVPMLPLNSTMVLILTVLALLHVLRTAFGGSTSLGGACTTDNNHIDPATHKLITDCDEKTFCSGPQNGTCQTRGCRRHEFPFGFDPRDELPTLCDNGSFCPDEGSQCQSTLAVGSTCQINRDDQCSPPENADELASSQNSDGAICLSSTCM